MRRWRVNTESGKSHEREFDLLMSRCGIEVPPDRRAGALAVYLEMKRLAELMRQPRDAESEPSNVFSLHALLRTE
jgi:hypothetical protein